MKSEPEAYSIADLQRERKAAWDGVRNYQARNLMMNEMKVGDPVLFYHSNADPTGVAGIAEVSKPAFPDPEALNKNSKYYDPKSTRENPRWYCVEVAYRDTLPRVVTLAELKAHPDLGDLLVIRRGQRLSILPCTEQEFDIIVGLATS